MTTITLKKIDQEDFLILQNVVAQLRQKALNKLQNSKVDNAYFNNILFVDITTSIFFRIRTKIENQTKSFSNLKLKIYEAIILLQCCNDYESSNAKEKFISRKYFSQIHKHITNL
ncbi:hypothetical protein BC749_108170 [Flavobacterium araucananum]|uniref:Uncharacterized protein n=1 Tax=Flavobacterium araucananum TaxID=946678 RepID=A0A227NRU6_9FLAO|nr:hypothetical protein [Flavobacterium araucananum]OXE99997.1 hypothetical protein B0A64_20785 [Flavobacterium araucananum]PWJ97020.1 hypothetical protein BC749_108170 [Flavobacterium araucananum]